MKWNDDNINNYLTKIEGAILRGKYNLALWLANRLLKQHYKSFILTKISTDIEKENLRKMSLSITRYLTQHYRNCTLPSEERRMLMMTITTDVVDVHNYYTNDSKNNSIIDKATATYVYENVKSVVRYLRKYF